MLVTALTGISTVLGFARDVVIGAVFGAGPDLDAWFIAQGVMNVVLGLIAWAMARSATPVLSREAAVERDRGSACGTHRSFDVTLTVTVVVLGVAAVVMGLLARPVLAVLAPGFSDDVATTAELLTRVMLAATVLVAATDLLAALAQAHGRFSWSALEGVPFNLVMIAAAGAFGPRYGIVALPVGYVLGSAARLALQLIPLRALGTRVRPRWDLTDPGFRQIARLVPPMIVGNAVVNVNTLVDRAVSSTLGDGSITALSYGWRLVDLPETVLIASLLVPLYPAFGAAAADRAELRRLVHRGLSIIVAVLTPVCAVLLVAAGPLVTMAFAHGQFDTDATSRTVTAVVWYTPALLALGCRHVVVRASYALGDSRGPVIVAVAAMVVNVIGDVTLGPLFGIAGVAASTSASLALAAVANGALLARRHDSLDRRATGRLIRRTLVLGTAAGAGGWLARLALPDWPDAVVVIILALVVGGIYLLGLIATRAPEYRLLIASARAVLKRG